MERKSEEEHANAAIPCLTSQAHLVSFCKKIGTAQVANLTQVSYGGLGSRAGSGIPLRLVFLLLWASAMAHAQEPNYDAELQRTMKRYPPGDYDGTPVRRFSPTTVIEKVKVVPTFNLLEPVEPSDKDNGTLISEAAEYFTSGRWDLSMKRYRQLLLTDPENKDAKANLFDILLLQSMYSDDAHLNEAAKKHREMRERLLKDIVPKK